MTNQISVQLKIRKFSKTSPSPEIFEKNVTLNANIDYNALKSYLYKICDLKGEDKVMKLRQDNEILVPLTFLLDQNIQTQFFYVDVCPINFENKSTAVLLQDAYIDSVRNKLQNMESRIVKAETLLPQLEWRRQAHLEETVGSLSSKVSFLNRRVDELLPSQWRSKMPQTMA